MRCFVTGATGFVGSVLVRRLLAEGHEVHALIRNVHASACWRLAGVVPEIHLVESDLSRLDSLASLLPAIAPDVLFHLAWDGVGSGARNAPVQLVENVNHTLKMLDLCRLSGCPLFVGLGSQAEYGIAQGVLSEESPCRPVTAYGVAKYSLSQLATKFSEVADMRVLWFRLFSAYGPKDDPNHMLPSLITSLLEGSCPALTLGEQRWDYLYVEDAVEGMLAAVVNSNAQGIFNLASGRIQTLRTVIEFVRDEIDPGLPVGLGALPYRPDQVMHLEGDIGRLSAATGWEPRFSLQDGLRATVGWYKENRIHATG